MNRIISVIILLISCCAISYAQPKALGLRGGASGTAVTYQHYLSHEKFLSVDAGVDFGYSVSGKLGALLWLLHLVSCKWVVVLQRHSVPLDD